MRKSKLRKKIIDLAHRRFKKNINKWKCSYPTCSKKTINSHTISQSSLQSIVDEQNKVYGPQQNFLRAINFDNYKSQFDEFNYLGIKEASSHSGFCYEHDNNIFECIENGNRIKPNNKEQLTFLFFRAVCSEFFQQKEALEFRKCIREVNEENNCLPLKENYELKRIDYFNSFLEPLFNDLFSGSQLNLHTRYFKVKKIPFVTCSLIQFPEYYEWGECFSLNIISQTEESSEVFFSVLDQHKSKLENLLQIDDENLFDLLIECAFKLSSNVYCSPSWWNNLSHDERESLSNSQLDYCKSMLLK